MEYGGQGERDQERLEQVAGAEHDCEVGLCLECGGKHHSHQSTGSCGLYLDPK